MTFLVLLLALALEKFSGWRRRIQRDGAWLAWLSLVEDLPSVSRRSWLGLLLAVVLPLLPLALLLTLLQPLAYGWLSLPLHLLVVVYSLGRGDVAGRPRAVPRRLAARGGPGCLPCRRTRSGDPGRQRAN